MPLAAPAPAPAGVGAATARQHALLAAAPRTPGPGPGLSHWSPKASAAVPRALPEGWLQALRAATPAWSAAQPSDLSAPPARELELWQDGSAQGQLRLGQGRVLWCAALGACQVSAADPAALSALLAMLPPD